ncbi:MAG: endonuclease/exonuclease/phosphatase family protein [Acidiferrobacterales bacterium]|nr:endonuclease/exonuclease/phosphatase family protein [Acidiferrobacterales bacterium]
MAKGVDNVTSIERIADVIKQMGESDIICCQEVVQEFAEDGVPLVDQPMELASHFPAYRCEYGPAIDRTLNGKRIRFGNIILSKLPVLSIAHHQLPQPADPKTKNMARQAIEIVVCKGNQTYRVVTTHLEYFSGLQRSAHVHHLRDIYSQCCDRALAPSLNDGPGFYQAPPETDHSIFCGDFNLTPFSDQYRMMLGESHTHRLLDAWQIQNQNQPHPPTCGIFDHAQWPEGPHCRDYFFISPQLEHAIQDLSVNTQSNASDHQPLRLVLQA